MNLQLDIICVYIHFKKSETHGSKYISKQLDAAIEFGDEKLIRRLLMIGEKITSLRRGKVKKCSKRKIFIYLL